MSEPKLYHIVITLEINRVKKNILVVTENPEKIKRQFNEFMQGNLTSEFAKFLKIIGVNLNE